MSKKRLNENTIRRFMKLASIGTLSENFLEDIKENEEEITENEEEITEGEEEITEGEEDAIEEGKAGDMGRKDVANVVPNSGQLKEEEELEDEEPMGDPEMAPVEEPAAEPMAGGMVNIADFMAAFEAALEQTTGETVETEIDTGEEAPAEEAPMDDAAPAAGEMEEPPAKRGMYEELLDDAGIDVINEDDIVSEVVRRVAKRLVQSKLRK